MRFLVGAAIAASFTFVMAGPAAAYQVINEVGPHGHYSLDDTFEMPAATCKYGDVVYSNWAYLVRMNVKAPHVFAADRNSAIRDHRIVSWQWKLQRKRYDALAWKTIKLSAIQRKTAYEDQQAAFSAMAISYDSEKEDPGHTSGSDVIYRAMVIIKWFKPDGSVESTVKLVPSFYQTKTYWAASPSMDYCGRVNTDG